jgi:putative transposase
MRAARSHAFEPELIDQLVAGRDARAVFERNGVLDKLRHALSERFPDYGSAPRRKPQRRAPDLALLEIDGPMDLARFQLRFPDLSERMIALHAKGYPPAEIQRRASMLVGQTVPADIIAALLSDIRREAVDWQSRALEPTYPIIVFERMRVKWRDGAAARNRLCHFALGFQANGPKEVLGLWFEGDDERAFWRGVLADLKQRGVADVLYILGASEQLRSAMQASFSSAIAIANVGDYVRQSLELATSKDRSTLAKELRAIHGAPSAEAALDRLTRFAAERFGQKYPAIVPLWQRHWQELQSFFGVPFEIRRVMGSTYAADTLRRAYGRSLRGHGHITSTEDAIALMYLVVRDALRKWRRPQREWHAAKTQLAVLFAERFAAN